MIHHLDISNINKLFIECRQVDYWQSIKEPDVEVPAEWPSKEMESPFSMLNAEAFAPTPKASVMTAITVKAGHERATSGQSADPGRVVPPCSGRLALVS
jgi:hypothetical protein